MTAIDKITMYMKKLKIDAKLKFHVISVKVLFDRGSLINKHKESTKG